ncbi:sensor histidine kinase [Anaerocolumna aminovalerica]|uniref:sensor histidine kinase n=1 Tax=Anaerocolumna aminovalerica TaxID=1527 RepID=UPI001C0EB8FB|nr:sensor histidine kinase [Anaerocolumna aminovalerica]MBU5332643.1 sensor histidine kinase [Anaerocolumna aminovalerica]
MKAKIIKLLQRAVHYYRHKSIQFTLSISFTLVALTGMGFMGTIIYSRFISSTKEIIIGNNKQVIEQVNLNLNIYLRNMMRISNAMYYSVIKKIDLSNESLDKEMNLLYEANKDNLVSIVCFRSNGSLVAATPINNLKKNLHVTKQNWFVKANQEIENLHFSTPHVQNLFHDSSFNYHWVISLSRVVELTYNGNINRGILLVDMNYSGIEQIFAKVNSNNSGYVYLIDSNGEIIYHPKQNLINSSLLHENNKVAATYKDGTHEEDFEAEERIVTVRTVGYTGWKIVNVTPAKEFYMSCNQMKFFTGMIIALTIFLITFAIQFVSYLISNPLKKLDDSVKDLEYGKLDLNIYIGGSYEIQHLGRTITSVVLQMHELMKEIVIEQEKKRKSEFESLQAQINPHFLYNTLDSIVWMVESERYQEAISMVTALASLFRISLSKGKNIITIQEEIEHAQNYLYIQKIRYKNRFQVKIDIASEIYECSTIKLIVQPLLENAIYHGVEYMDGEGEITIKGYLKDEDIYIDVIDNGLGMPEEEINLILRDNTRVHKKGSGIGLSNVHQRIQLYFGPKYGLLIDSELDEGTTVHIHLPRVKYNGNTLNGEEDS